MKKYILGVILIVAVMAIGEVKFFGDAYNAYAAPACASASSIPAGIPACGSGNSGNCDSGLMCGKPLNSSTYCWMSGTACATTAGGPAGNSSTNGITPSLSGATPTLSWTPVLNAASYNLQIATDASFSNIVLSKTDLIGNTFRADSGLQPNTTYYWRASAKNSFGASPYSTVWSFKTAPARLGSAPERITSGNITEDFYSLLSSFATWIRADGSKIMPKQVIPVQIYQDENGTRIFPSVDSVNAIALINSFVADRSGGDTGSGSTQKSYGGCSEKQAGGFKLVGSGSNVHSAQCCVNNKGGWSWQYPKPVECGAGIAVGGEGADVNFAFNMPCTVPGSTQTVGGCTETCIVQAGGDVWQGGAGCNSGNGNSSSGDAGGGLPSSCSVGQLFPLIPHCFQCSDAVDISGNPLVPEQTGWHLADSSHVWDPASFQSGGAFCGIRLSHGVPVSTESTQ